jgi:hypothetical protein
MVIRTMRSLPVHLWFGVWPGVPSGGLLAGQKVPAGPGPGALSVM